ncbi:hypothetical protein YC2023_068265 [Brassica napus]
MSSLFKTNYIPAIENSTSFYSSNHMSQFFYTQSHSTNQERKLFALLIIIDGVEGFVDGVKVVIAAGRTTARNNLQNSYGNFDTIQTTMQAMSSRLDTNLTMIVT